MKATFEADEDGTVFLEMDDGGVDIQHPIHGKIYLTWRELARISNAAQHVHHRNAAFGSEDDPNIGWRGECGDDIGRFYCEFCAARHHECTEQPHEDDCPITIARAALALAKGET